MFLQLKNVDITTQLIQSARSNEITQVKPLVNCKSTIQILISEEFYFCTKKNRFYKYTIASLGYSYSYKYACLKPNYSDKKYLSHLKIVFFQSKLNTQQEINKHMSAKLKNLNFSLPEIFKNAKNVQSKICTVYSGVSPIQSIQKEKVDR